MSQWDVFILLFICVTNKGLNDGSTRQVISTYCSMM